MGKIPEFRRRNIRQTGTDTGEIQSKLAMGQAIDRAFMTGFNVHNAIKTC